MVCGSELLPIFRRAIWRYAARFNAGEVLGIIAASGTIPAGDLWIGTDRTSAINAVVGYVRRIDVVRGSTLLNPPSQSTQHIVLRIDFDVRRNRSEWVIAPEEIWSRSPTAVGHSRHHEKPKK